MSQEDYASGDNMEKLLMLDKKYEFNMSTLFTSHKTEGVDTLRQLPTLTLPPVSEHCSFHTPWGRRSSHGCTIRPCPRVPAICIRGRPQTQWVPLDYLPLKFKTEVRKSWSTEWSSGQSSSSMYNGKLIC